MFSIQVSLHPIYSDYVREIVFDGTLYDGLLARDSRLYSRTENATGRFPSEFFFAMRPRYVVE